MNGFVNRLLTKHDHTTYPSTAAYIRNAKIWRLDKHFHISLELFIMPADVHVLAVTVLTKCPAS